MARIPVFGLGMAAKSPFVTAKLMQNMYAEQRTSNTAGQSEKSVLVGFQTPGLNLFADFGAPIPRGGQELESTNLAYVVVGGTFYEVNNAGTYTSRGTLLTTSGRVSMADNGTQILIVDGTYGYLFVPATLAFTQITDPGFPTSPVTATFLSGRFSVNSLGSGRFYYSAMYDGLTWPALNFQNAETNPDPVAAMWASNGQLIPLGTRSMEFWGNSGALDTPFTQIVGTATEWGIAAVWSAAKFDNSFACLVRNRTGQAMVAKIAGYLPQKISNPDLDSIINGYANIADATALSFMLGGHPMYVISFPSAGASWMYDGSTGAWTQLKSFGMSLYRGAFAFSFLGNIIVADNSVGRLYKLTASALTENGASIERMLISETIADPDLDRLEVNKFRVDIQVGSGTTSGQGVNPQIGLSVSRDNGKTYGSEMWRSMGALGDYGLTIDWENLGTARNFVFKLRVTDPIPFVLASACVNPAD
jgi:hypothetical protein